MVYGYHKNLIKKMKMIEIGLYYMAWFGIIVALKKKLR